MNLFMLKDGLFNIFYKNSFKLFYTVGLIQTPI